MNTVGQQSSSAPSGRAFSMPTWCCLWIYLLLDTTSWKSNLLKPPCTYTPVPPPLQITAASVTTSRSSSLQSRLGHHSACKLSPNTMSWGTRFLNAPPFLSPSGRQIQISPSMVVADRKLFGSEVGLPWFLKVVTIGRNAYECVQVGK